MADITATIVKTTQQQNEEAAFNSLIAAIGQIQDIPRDTSWLWDVAETSDLAPVMYTLIKAAPSLGLKVDHDQQGVVTASYSEAASGFHGSGTHKLSITRR